MFALRSLAGRHLASRPVCQPCCAPALQSRTALRVTAEVKPIVIEKLQRAPSAYNLFYRSKYGDVKTKLTTKAGPPGLADCSKELFKLWSAMSDSQKAPFVKEAEGIKQKFEAAKAAGKLIARVKRGTKPKGPPKPPNAYAIFMKEQFAGFKSKNPKASVTDIAKLVAGMWKGMTEQQKSTYKTKADKLKAEYAAKNPAPAKPAGAPAKPAAKAASPAARAATPATPTTASPPAAAAKARPASVKKGTPAK